ncbi:helix-turn-helix domain-containing protein [Olleya sp. UBA1516]|uniref:helix-turn-helix domain-containing protein n=1 Tax=Olleya sp. UBA1516 TaxID=1947013 RepID=UPI0025E3A63B|nr:helix-turn-helix domain-containing protein [Olleya sp. UBA1516]|tara:strand:+ start:115759 stop:116028 length:270 start_codon:yes stop_codon:yes gene_type:complete
MESIIQLHNMEPKKLIGIIKTIIHEELELLQLYFKNLNNDEYFTRKQAAKFLHISETTLWNLDKTQILPAKRLNGKVLYLKSDLLNFCK